MDGVEGAAEVRKKRKKKIAQKKTQVELTLWCYENMFYYYFRLVRILYINNCLPHSKEDLCYLRGKLLNFPVSVNESLLRLG